MARLPKDFGEESIASDWLTGETSSDVTYREGKWWTTYHYDHWRRDRIADRRRLDRNRGLRTFLRTQTASTGL